MEDYEVFHPECHILQICEIGESSGNTNDQSFPLEYGKYQEVVAWVEETPTHWFEREKPIKYEESNVEKVNLGKDEDPQVILVVDNWNLILKAAAFRIFLEYKDVFTWTYKDLKGVPPELCVYRISHTRGPTCVEETVLDE